MATSTPWGPSQSAHQMAKGVMSYSTASHGGIHVSHTVNMLIPDYMRIIGGWYEEDCDWCLPVIALASKMELNFDHHVEPHLTYYQAFHTFQNWHPDKFERFFNCILAPGESYIKDKRTKAANG